jgi:hypothetical protein
MTLISSIPTDVIVWSALRHRAPKTSPLHAALPPPVHALALSLFLSHENARATIFLCLFSALRNQFVLLPNSVKSVLAVRVWFHFRLSFLDMIGFIGVQDNANKMKLYSDIRTAASCVRCLWIIEWKYFWSGMIVHLQWLLAFSTGNSWKRWYSQIFQPNTVCGLLLATSDGEFDWRSLILMWTACVVLLLSATSATRYQCRYCRCCIPPGRVWR